jgi:hypothetical protein
VLLAVLEEHLHPHADAQDGASAGQAAPDRPWTVDGAQTRHAGCERTDPGYDEAVGVLGGGPVGGELHRGAGPLQGADGRAEVAGAVVQDDDAGGQSEPFVDGTPVSRGSIDTASRNARANALNCASTRW